ncbi:MAG: ABC transporter permease subunit [Nitriliruptorales bacterium]|nr:ABC transporter permease subunit [Nitriliruptorales bacterium]
MWSASTSDTGRRVAVAHVSTTARERPLSGLANRLDWRRLFQPQVLIILTVVIIVGYLAMVPVLYLLWGTFYDGATLTLRFFGEAYSAFGLGEMISNSFSFAIGSTVLSVTLGTTLAYLTVRTNVPFKGLLFAASLVPLIIPGILHTIAWIFLASPRVGLFNRLLEPIVGPGFFNIFTMWGMMFVEGLHLSPLVFLLMFAAFRSMDPSLEESALMSGARLPTVLRRVTLPLAKPAMYASILIMGVRALEAFEVPALLGIPNGVWVFTSRIWRVLNQFPANYGQAGAYALSLLALTTVGVFWQSRLSNRGKSFQTVTGKGFRPHPMDLGVWRWPATALVLSYFVFAVVMPVLILVYASFQPFYSVPSMASLQSFTLENYAYTLTNSQALRASRNSLMLGIGTATVVMFLMAIASWLVVRTKTPGRWMIDNLSFLPLTIPGLVMGVALLFVYLRFPIPVYGTIWILFIAYFTRYMPYGMRYASTSMYQISGELEESAQTSGATWWQTFRRVNLPLLMPGLLAGWIYIVMVSVRELSSSILLYSPGNEVLSILIWEQWENGQFTELASLGVLMVLALVALVVIAQRLGAKVGVQGH